MTDRDKLDKRLEVSGFVRIGEIHRTYAGRNQRAAGAWSWWIDVRNKKTTEKMVLGGYFPLRDLMRDPGNCEIHEALWTRDMEIDPNREHKIYDEGQR